MYLDLMALLQICRKEFAPLIVYSFTLLFVWCYKIYSFEFGCSTKYKIISELH